MQLLRRISLAAFALAAFSVPAAAQELPSGQQVVDRYVEAIGGRARVQAIQSRRLTYEISAGGQTITMVAAQRRPNLSLVTMSTGAGELRTGFDGTTAWMISPMGPQLIEGAAAEEVRARSGFDADVAFDGLQTVETTERAEYAGKACWKVRMVTTAGAEAFRCFDVNSGMLVAVETTQNGMPVTAVYDEFRDFGGLTYPSRISSQAMGQQVTTTLLNVDHADIPASEFALPDAVKALQP